MRTHAPTHPAAAMLHVALLAAALILGWMGLAPSPAAGGHAAIRPTAIATEPAGNDAFGACTRRTNAFAPMIRQPTTRPFTRRTFSHWT